MSPFKEYWTMSPFKASLNIKGDGQTDGHGGLISSIDFRWRANKPLQTAEIARHVNMCSVFKS